MLVLAPWRSAVEQRLENAEDALENLVVVLSSDVSGSDLRLPPPFSKRTRRAPPTPG
jgi:uncharacterized protein YhdP